MFAIKFQPPATRLQHYVQFYAQHEFSLRDPLFVRPVPARASPMLEFMFGDRIGVLRSGAAEEEISPRTVVVGMLSGPHGRLRLQGKFQGFVIMFRATGLEDLFAAPMNELTNHDYDSRSVLGRPITELDEHLSECDSFQQRVDAANAFLASLIPARPRKSDRASVATRLITLSDGRVRIPELASSLGISQRQLEREFAARFAMTPKLYARLIRFQAALDRKARSDSKSWTDVAHELGYHDQMHLIHDFEEFSAGTPTETLRILETLFREQIRSIQLQMGTTNQRLVPRFIL
jgi:AraC-like DNA-binding protein